jgi:hypothetical protein
MTSSGRSLLGQIAVSNDALVCFGRVLPGVDFATEEFSGFGEQTVLLCVARLMLRCSNVVSHSEDLLTGTQEGDTERRG